MKKGMLISMALLCLWISSVAVDTGSSEGQMRSEDAVSEPNELEMLRQDFVPQQQRETVKDPMVEDLERLRDEANKFFSKLEPAQKRVIFGNKVLSFETLDGIERYDDLPKYGLVAPEQYNHRSGSNLVLLALRATSWLKGDWVMAHGLLGINMLDVDVHARTGYRSLFLSPSQRTKMHGSYTNNRNGAFLAQTGSLTSVIAVRESLIYRISWELNARYIYGDDGTFARKYLPEKKRKSNEQLKQLLIDGLMVYDKFSQMEFDDKTLKDTLGMACASLDYDGVYLSYTVTLKLGVRQIYSDALTATLTRLKGTPEHSYEFLEALGEEMRLRGLATYDEILTPSNDRNHQAILKIVQDDLKNIEQVSKKSVDDMRDTKRTRTEQSPDQESEIREE